MKFICAVRTEKSCTVLEFPLMCWNTARNRILGEGKKQEVRHTICISDGCLEEIAEYGSKERCLEVLDVIERVCGHCLTWGGEVGSVPRVYQMPEQ